MVNVGIMIPRKPDEPEWCWSMVGNIVKERSYGENNEIMQGTKHFKGGTKVYIAPIESGYGDGQVIVIGNSRYRARYIEVIMNRKDIENLRMQKVYRPAVLSIMRKSKYIWWGNTAFTQDKIRKNICLLTGKEQVSDGWFTDNG